MSMNTFYVENVTLLTNAAATGKLGHRQGR
jgi:hypothetical protein